MRSSSLIPKNDSQEVIYYDSSKLRELQRLAELGRLSATLLHEISNPLTSALLHLEQYDDKSSSNLREARRSILLLRRYVEAARQQVRKESIHAEFKIRHQVSQLKRIVLPLASNTQIKLYFGLPPSITLCGDPVKFQQILVNLIVNAIEAYSNTEITGKVKLVKVGFSIEGNCLKVEVTDWGHGINVQQIGYVFDPFYTTKLSSSYGLGIGLAIVKEHAQQDFGGTISVKSGIKRGTTFTLNIPLKRAFVNASDL